jgi:hypothetical protein
VSLQRWRAFFKASFRAQQLEEDATHSARDDGDGGVGLLATSAMLAIK